MIDFHSAAAEAAASEIIARRDQLLAARAKVREERLEILIRLRNIERDLADCRAAARFFGLKIEFPSDEDDDANRASAVILAHRMEQAAKREAEMSKRRSLALAEQAEAQARQSLHQHLESPPGQPSVATVALPNPPRPSRPTLREAVLSRLAAAEDRGLKAAPIREWFETTFGEQIHEKTVGMTLYRLQKEGLVRHEGHVWFLVPPKAETGNPGAVTPGPFNPQT
jgi:hypothetical protein